MSAMPRQKEPKISPSETRKYLWLGAAAVLGVGYADLWRGGITLSAFALAIGYCGLVPAAIWAGRARGTVDGDGDRPSYGAASLTALAVFGLYVATMAPSTAMWDTSEYITAAYTFGLPHPPGNPLFVIIGRMFSVLPVAATVAARVNVLAALSSAAAAGFWFLVAERVARRWIGARPLRVTIGVLAALIGATAFTVWNQSVVNEKVYTVSLAGIAAVSWLAVRWSSSPDDPRSDAMLLLIAYLCGLGYANHMAGMLPAPAVGLAVLARRPSTALRFRLLLSCAALMVLGLTPFATQPIRAAHFPAIDEGEPTGCRQSLALSCTLSSDTFRLFEYNFDRGQYGKPDLADRQASLGEQTGMWWMYFRWQWLRDVDASHPFLQSLLATTFLALGLAGAWVHFRRDRETFWYFGALMFTLTLLLVYYLNFKLGASQDPGSPNEHEVRDRDYFYLWSFSAWGVWAALGLSWLWRAIAEGIEPVGGAPAEPSASAWRRASPALLLAVVPLFANRGAASRAHHRTTRNVAADLLNSVEPYGVLVTVGDNDTFPLWYAQEVEGIRRDVVVACTSLLNTDWYVRQLIRRPIYPYDVAAGPAVYRGRAWRRPTHAPLRMTLDEADAVPPYYALSGPTAFTAGPYHATIDPRLLPHGVLERADAIVLRMILDSWQERPIYFARSAGGYPRSLGLGDDVLTQGLASKLFIPPAKATRDTVPVEGDGWLDVTRTRALWNDVFTGHASTIAEGRWVDRPSASIPLLYVFTGAELGEALRMRGDAAESRRVLDTAARVATAAGFPDVVRQIVAATSRPPAGDSSGVTLGVDRSAQPQTRAADPAVPRRRP